MFDASLAAHAERDIPRSIDLAQQAIAADPNHVEALEHLASLLITRRRAFGEGLPLIERAVALRPDDAGVWYSLGWDYEFAAHELQRRPPARTDLDFKQLYERAAEGFRQCLGLSPAGKLQGDAEDLLDHVDNELRSL